MREKRSVCKQCKGTGIFQAKTIGDIPCYWCNGTGMTYNVHITRKTKKEESCPWCKGDYKIVDNDFAQYIHPSLINYCFGCGRKRQVK